MPLPVPIPASVVPGQFDPAALWNANVYNGLTFLLNKPIATLLQTAATQTLTTATWTAITWDTGGAAVDTYGGFAAGFPSRYTAQIAGTLRFRGLVNFPVNSTGLRAAKLAKNGTPIQGAQSRAAPPTVTGATVAVEWPVPMAVGDYVELFGYQSSGGNLATLVDSETCCSLLVDFLHA